MEFKADYIIGKSYKIRAILDNVAKIASYDVSVLIDGESGTGKELIARAIHYNSKRKDNEFVVINCSAFSDNLLESELFGYLKGSFTGAIQEKQGLFELADNGTFFLDEVGDMSPALQVKLLRVLQEGTFLKIGGVKPIKVNVRIIAATNKNLKELVEKGEFRQDFYYRINVTSVTLPPLRERREDIEELCNYFLDKMAEKNNFERIRISDSALEILKNYSWPGNIRQLENEIERAAIFAVNGVIVPESISVEIREYREIKKSSKYTVGSGMSLAEMKKRVVSDLEKRLITEGLELTRGNKTECAKLLQISRVDLMRKISKYGIKYEKSEE